MMKVGFMGGRLLAVLLLSITFLAVSTAANAQQNSGSFAQGFQTDMDSQDVVAGALVSITSGDSQRVELATSASAARLTGVIDQNPLVAVASTPQEVQVVLSGTTNVLVSDINGPIKVSDKITASPIAGVGMLATTDSQVIGTAQANLELASSQTRTIKDSQGKAHTVHIGHVPLQVGVAFYQTPGSNFLPPFIQSVANSVAGRPVSLFRVLICSALLLLGFGIVGVLVATSVRSAMTSIGRNPLAASAIRKGLLQMGMVALIVLGGTLLASYLILSV